VQYVVTTLAGRSASGLVDGVGTSATFSGGLRYFAIGPEGDLYATSYYAVRRITALGNVTTIAGGTAAGSVMGVGTNARFQGLAGIAVLANGNIFVVDSNSHKICFIDAATLTVSAYAGTGSRGLVDATGTSASFSTPNGIAFSPDKSKLYVADNENNIIAMANAAVTTFAGSRSGTSGLVDSTGTNALFHLPMDIAVDAAGSLYIIDKENYAVRKATSAGSVSTLIKTSYGVTDGVGTNAKFGASYGIAVTPNGSTVYLAGLSSRQVKRLDVTNAQAVVTTIAGSTNEVSGTADGLGTSASFGQLFGIILNGTHTLYVGDGAGTVRIISF
jgi:DNA-binding beta-propeller fold protein YncE